MTMASGSPSSASLVLLFGSALLLSATFAAATTVDLQQLCKKTDYANLCYSTASQILKDEEVTPAGATKASILITIDSTKQAKIMAAKMKGLSGRDEMTSANFNVCRQVYDDALTNLQTALQNMKDRAFDDLKINLSAAITDYTTCDDGFEEDEGITSPLGKINRQLNMLTSNNLALAGTLH